MAIFKMVTVVIKVVQYNLDMLAEMDRPHLHQFVASMVALTLALLKQ
jgi:hypothetical protein